MDVLDVVLAETLLEEGETVVRVARATGLDAGAVAALDALPGGMKRAKAPAWTDAERAFLEAHIADLGEVGVAAALGRTPAAVKVKRQRWGVPAASKSPDALTLNQVAGALGVDVHAVVRWVDELGILRASAAPVEGRAVRVVTLAELKRFTTRPRHWVYFRPEGVTDPRLARLVQLAADRWGDAWLRIGEVARLHGVGSGAVNLAIRAGRLPAVDWGNWWVRRSDAEAARFTGGPGRWLPFWGDRIDAFLVLGTAVGVPRTTLARMTGGRVSDETVKNRLHTLHRAGRIEALIARAGLDVAYRADGIASFCLFADWKRHRRRFPGLARAMDAYAAGARLDAQGYVAVLGVCAAWMGWFGSPEEARMLRGGIGRYPAGRVRGALDALRALGVDPFE